MLFSRKKAIFGLFLTLLVASLTISNGNIIKNELFQVEDELMKMNISDVKPLLKLFPMPLAGIFGGNVLSIKTVDSFFKDSNDSRDSVLKLVKIKVAFAKLRNRVAKESKDVAEKFIPYDDKSSSYSSFSNMKQTLYYVFGLYSLNIACILENNCYQKSRQGIINKMINHASTERIKLLAIKSWSNPKPSSGKDFDPDKWFFDHVIEEYFDLLINDDDCNTESLHTRIFKAWVHLTNVLTKGYAVVAAAHAVELSRIISISSESQVDDLLQEWRYCLIEFRYHMEIITMDAKLKLDNSPREIRNCGSFNLVKGETFERLNFIQNRLIFHKTVFMEPCTEDDVGEPSLNNKMFFMFNCKDYEKAIVHLYMDRNDTERPFHQLDRIDENGSIEETMGRVGNESLHQKIIDDDHKVCRFTICQAYQREGLKYSTQFVQAQQDYVVTGIRWKIKKGVIYIEIQEGKFIDGTQVDESTVHWKETPENDKEVKFLDKNLRSIALADIILPEKIHVKGVSLKDVNGIITMVITGQGTDDTGTELLNETSRIYENTQLQNMIELNLEEPDDPEIAPIGAKNLVMREKNKYFVNFQPTDLKMDFGRTTIPYFDIREVVTTPSAPISGLGIYHEAVPGYGGFVGLKMFSPNFSYMINTDKFDSFLNFH